MDISSNERRILSTQFEILAQINSEDECARKFFEWQKEAVEKGYPIEVEEMFASINDNYSMTIKECLEVRDILTMYNDLQWSHENLSDKNGIDEKDLIFKGFDAHADEKAFFYMSFTLRSPSQSDQFLPKRANDLEHGYCLEDYKVLLKKWKGIEGRKPKNLTKEQIQSVLSS